MDYVSDSYFGGCNETLALRVKLQQYLYVPKMVVMAAAADQRRADVAGVVTNKVSTTTTTHKRRIRKRKLSSSSMANCNLCGIPLTGSRRQQLNQRNQPLSASMMSCLRFCQMCKRALARYYADESFNNGLSTTTKITSSQSKFVNPYVLSRLKKLGTTVVRESCAGGAAAAAARDDGNDLTSRNTTITCTDDSDVSSSTSSSSCTSKFNKNVVFLIDDIDDDDNDGNPHVIRSHVEDSNGGDGGGGGNNSDGYISCSNGQYRNEKNEIVLAFDRTVTEVFPAMTRVVNNGCGEGGGGGGDSDIVMIIDDDDNDVDDDDDDDERKHMGAVKDINVINDIYKRIPKSLSITLLA